jgi:hypothetical protein
MACAVCARKSLFYENSKQDDSSRLTLIVHEICSFGAYCTVWCRIRDSDIFVAQENPQKFNAWLTASFRPALFRNFDAIAGRVPQHFCVRARFWAYMQCFAVDIAVRFETIRDL